MNDVSLKTKFGGLELKNPIIVSSSGLTDTVEKIIKIENCNAAAVVLKSLFEEQIMLRITSELPRNEFVHPEEYDFLKNLITDDSLQRYINLIREAKRATKIPIIASVNCFSTKGWIEFATNIEKAGADAIEINIMTINTDKDFNYGKAENMSINILADLKRNLRIPVIMKMERNFGHLIALITQLQHNNADGVVIFNRPYSPDIDIRKMSFTNRTIYSSPELFGETLRWTALSCGYIPNIKLCSCGGIYNGEDIIKSLLAGASAVEICSLLYRHGIEIIPVLLSIITDWMKEYGFKTIEQFRGIMSYKAGSDENAYLRTQFMKYYSQHKL